MNKMLNRLWKLISHPLKQSFQRFPEAIITSFLLGLLMVVSNEMDGTNLVLVDINRSLFILLPLMILVTLMIERWERLTKLRLALVAIMVTIGILIFIFFRLETSLTVELNRFSNLAFTVYSLVIFTPYLMDRQDIGVGIIYFFTKLFTSLFYAIILYIGIFIILITTNILFGLSIDLIVYTNLLILILTYIFLPILLDSYPQKDHIMTVEKEYHVIWQRVFLFVVAPVIAVFSLLIVLYLFTGIVNSSGFEPEVYTFSALVIAFVGISSQIALTPFTKTNRFADVFVKYFHFALMIVMIGYYTQQFISMTATGINLNITIRLILGVWPLLYIYFVIIKSRIAIQRGLLSLSGAFLLIAAFPGLNAVSLTTMLLKSQFEQTLQRESMLSEDGQIIRKAELAIDTYNDLMATVNEMASLGLQRFPMIPDGYEHPGDFEATFGDRQRDPVDPDDESLFYVLDFSIIDLTDFRYESLTYIDSLFDLENTPYTSSTIALSLVKDNENHEYLFTVTRNGISETVDLYQDVALVLQARFGENSFETDNPEELLVQFTFETFALDIWVMNLGSSKFKGFSNFSMSFYLGLSSQND
jgi:hypothetical protein